MDKERALGLIEECERACASRFEEISKIALENQKKVLDAFIECGVGTHHFAGSYGYGYNDGGREMLCKVFARTFRAESAIVSPHLLSGTHALTVALFGLLHAKDTLLSISGAPYDTLKQVIGGKGVGSLADFGVEYRECGLQGGGFDYDAIKKELVAIRGNVVVFITRSRGYEWREALSLSDIREAAAFVKSIRSDAVVFVDNCYGEFVCEGEPLEFGADLIAGSLIKNAGGGIAPTGGYILGRADLVERAAARCTAPFVGNEIGSYAMGYQPFFMGLFLAPHITKQALMGAELFGAVFRSLGLETSPQEGRVGDIIRAVKFNNRDKLIEFARSIQASSPIDSMARLEPCEMPGYEDEVIMAAGTFVAGSSIELSCDAPMRPPFIAYIQGGLTFEHIKLAIYNWLISY